MLAESKIRKLTPEEYLELEEKAEFKSEYWDGVMIPMHGDSPEMIGASINHNQICANLIETLSPKLKKQGCRTLSNDLKVWIEKRRRFFYPDVVIICGKVEFYRDRRDTILNPIVLIEILSDSTQAKDRAEKFWSYQTLESFEEYVLISQHSPVVERYLRQPDGSWKYLATIGLESVITHESVNVLLNLQEIYDLVELESEEL